LKAGLFVPNPFETVRGIVEKYRGDRFLLIKALFEIQDEVGYLSDPMLAMLADGFKISKTEVQGVATFYPHFLLKARPRYLIRCCSSVVCEICGSAKLREAIQKTLRFKNDEISQDGLFQLSAVACLGACDRAPALKINETLFGPLTGEMIPALLQKVASSGLQASSGLL